MNKNKLKYILIIIFACIILLSLTFCSKNIETMDNKEINTLKVKLNNQINELNENIKSLDKIHEIIINNK